MSESETIERMQRLLAEKHASTDKGWKERKRPGLEEKPEPPKEVSAESDDRPQAMVEWLNNYAETQANEPSQKNSPPGESEPPTFKAESPPQEAPVQESRRPDVGEHPLSEFERLARLGYAERRVEIGGNAVDIRTLTQSEEMLILEEVGKYAPLAQRKAQQIFTVALALRQINDEPYRTRQPLGPSSRTEPEANNAYLFIKTLNGLHSSVVDAIYAEYSKLRDETDEKALFMGKG